MSKKTENMSKKRGRKTPKLLTVSQLSEALGVKSQGLYRKIRSGAIVRRADGLIDISTIPENRAFLKARGYVPSKIRIPRPGTPGRPVKGTARTRGPVVVTAPAGRDIDKSELKKEKIARQCLLLQEQVKVIFEGHIPVTAARLYCNLYLQFSGEEYETFIGEASAALQAHFGITLDDGRAATLAAALRRETDSVLQAKRTAIEKFLRSLKRRNVEAPAPATARKIPDHIRALVADGNLTLARLMALPTKSDTEKVRLALEIQRIEKQTQIARGEWITLARWKRFHGEALRALDQRLYAIPWRIGADLAEVFGEPARDETTMFHARNIAWEMSYGPPRRAWQRISDFRQEKGKNG